MEMLRWRERQAPIGRRRLKCCEESGDVGVFEAFERASMEELGAAVARVAELLESGFAVERMPGSVLERAIELAGMGSVGVNVVRNVLRIIELCGNARDGECQEFVSADVVGFLMECLGECDDGHVIRLAFAAIAALMDPEKERTVAKMGEVGFDHERVLELAESRMQDSGAVQNDSCVSSCIHLLKNLFCSLSLDRQKCDVLMSVVCSCYDESAFREWKVDVMQALGCMAFWKPKLFKDYVNERMLDRICSAISVDDEMLSAHGFVAVDNVCYDNKVAACYLIVQKDIMNFLCPPSWSPDSFVRYCRALVTVISSACDRDSTVFLSAIKHRAQTLIAEVMRPWEASSFAVKEVVAHLMCNLVNIGDGELTQLIVTGNWILVDYLCEMLSSSDAQLVCSVLSALVSLCSYGDKVAFNLCHLLGKEVTGCPNPFLERVSVEHLDSLLENILDSFSDSDYRKIIVVRTNWLRQEVERAAEFLQIDFM